MAVSGDLMPSTLTPSMTSRSIGGFSGYLQSTIKDARPRPRIDRRPRHGAPRRRHGPSNILLLFQVFAAMQEDADLSPDTEVWLTPKGPYAPALLQIAPASSPIRWPPEDVFGAGDREALAGRLRHGLSPAAS